MAGRTRRRVSLGRVLLVGQVALSLVSLITAGLACARVQRAYAIDPGFESQRLGILMINPGQAGYTRAQSEQFFRDARARVAAIPGVTSVSWATNLPMFSRPSRAVSIVGQEARNEGRGDMTRRQHHRSRLLRDGRHSADARPRFRRRRSRRRASGRDRQRDDGRALLAESGSDRQARALHGRRRRASGGRRRAHRELREPRRDAAVVRVSAARAELHRRRGALRADRGGRSRAGARHGAARDSFARSADPGARRAHDQAGAAIRRCSARRLASAC